MRGNRRIDTEVRKEALDFVRKHPISHLATVEEGKPCNRVMNTLRTDDDFAIWYYTSASSNKIRQIAECPNVSITFCEGGEDLRVLGKAEIKSDEETKHEMWKDDWGRYFPEGKDDPDYVLIKVIPEKIEYRNRDKHGWRVFDVL